jgi:NtrC-family two-component system sensor histidine kinase KinB
MWEMNQRQRSIVSVMAAIVVLAVLVGLTVAHPPSPELLLPGLLFLLLLVFTHTFGVPLAGGRASLLPTTTVAAYLVLGLVPAGWVAFLGALLHGAVRYRWAEALGERPSSSRGTAAAIATVNAVLQTASILVAGAVYQWRGGITPYTGAAGREGWALLPLALTYLGMNLLLAGLYLALQGRERLRLYLRSLHQVLLFEAWPLIFAPLMALIYNRLGLFQFVLMALALVVASLVTRNLSLARQRLERRVAELDSLQAVGQALSASLDLDTTLVAIHTQVARLMPARNFYIALYSPEIEEVSFRLAMEGGERVHWRSRRTGSGLTEYVLRTRVPLLIRQDYEATVEALGIEKIGRPATSWLGVPILAGAEALGVIAVQSFSARQAYDTSHQEVLVTIAAQAAVAIQNARLYAHTDQALARRVQELDSILRTVQEGILLFDREHRVLAANRALADFLGLAQLEFLGRSLPDVPSEGEPPLLSLLRYTLPDLEANCQAIAQGELDLKKEEIVLNGPLEKHFERTLSPVHNREGEISGWLLVLRDLTEERALAQLREEMTNMLVHDLRSPLTVLISGLELINMELATGDMEAVGEVLALAKQGSDRVLRLVNDLLDISRLESGQMSIASQPMQIKPLLQEVATRLAPLAEQAQITLEIAAEADLPPLNADTYILDRVVHNLVDNAIKFTPDGGQVRLWARLEPDGDPAAMLVGVTDTGPGIPLNAQPRLFQKFQQINPGAGRRKGTGLGLPFCKLAVEAHGGQIWVESEPGRGSTFVMRLPLAVESS